MDQLHLESIASERERERASLELVGRARDSRASRPLAVPAMARGRLLLSRLIARRGSAAPGRERRLAE